MTTTGAATPPPSGHGLALAEVTRRLNAWLQIDLDALEANARRLAAAVAPAEVIAVVKANAYGAGIEGVAPALAAAGVPAFAVVWVEEGLALRRILPHHRILVLGHTHPELAAEAVAANLTLSVDSLELARAISCASAASEQPTPVHIHIDSGLHRDGLAPSDALALAQAIAELPGIALEGLSTHMANADELDDSFSSDQAAAFAQVCDALTTAAYVHAANSATALRRPGLRLSGVRIGLAMHGILPENTDLDGLRPILSVHARLARVSRIRAGEGVSYGLTWRASGPAEVGLVPVGYADGWKRALSRGGAVLVGGRPAPVIGRIMMDQFVVDVTGLKAAAADEVVLLGPQGDDRIDAWSVAETAGTIAWDITASLTSRLARVYHRGGIVERVVRGSHAT
ncbi:MAG: alanine racemase [Dehalococcoidia bacterium]